MRRLSEHEVPAFAAGTLLSPARSRPVVVVTSHPGSERGWLDPDRLQAQLGDLAEVVFLETGEPTWALTEALPPRLDVYGGAVRIYWPGLARDSDPREHRLLFLGSPLEAERVERLLLEAVRARSRRAVETAAEPAGTHEPVRARVTALSREEIVLAGPEHRGPLREADVAPEFYVDALQVGDELCARPMRRLADGRWAFSIQGLSPDPWQRFAAEARVGDVFRGRVQNLHQEKGLVFVDVLPGVVGVCHARELDYHRAERLADFVQVGELLPFQVLAIDAAAGTLHLSRKRAMTEPPRPLPSLLPGGRPFAWRHDLPRCENLRRTRRKEAGPPAARPAPVRPPAPVAPAPAADARSDGDALAAMEQELAAANGDRADLRRRLQDARKQLRSADDRLAAAERRLAADDALASERAFLQAVRVCYARLFDEDDRIEHPLQRMRVGREFLASVRATDGIEVDKVVEVCAEVAAGIAHGKSGRDVHPLRAGSRGADARIRARDGARAWRCALQVNSPSARRLHWWNVPGPNGAVIEFATVGVHDQVDIPDA